MKWGRELLGFGTNGAESRTTGRTSCRGTANVAFVFGSAPRLHATGVAYGAPRYVGASVWAVNR